MARELIDNLATGQVATLAIAPRTCLAMMAAHDTGSRQMTQKIDAVEVGDRLRILRESLRLTRAEIADANHIDRTNWGRFEDGVRLITTDVAYRLKKRYGITFDWLYDGDVGSLPVKLAERFRQVS